DNNIIGRLVPESLRFHAAALVNNHACANGDVCYRIDNDEGAGSFILDIRIEGNGAPERHVASPDVVEFKLLSSLRFQRIHIHGVSNGRNRSADDVGGLFEEELFAWLEGLGVHPD